MSPRATDWKASVQGYHDYLVLERGLSKNSVMAYMRDIKQFMEFAVNEERVKAPMDIELPHVEHFLGHLYDRGLARNSQARMLRLADSIRNVELRSSSAFDVPTTPLRRLSGIGMNRKE